MWAELQQRDSFCIKMINEIHQTGGLGVLRHSAKYVLLKTDDGEDKLLVREFFDSKKGAIEYQTVVPKKLIKRTLKIHHEGFAHIGINRLTETIKLRYFWPKMDDDIKNHCDSCILCALRKTYQRRPKVPIMKYNRVSGPLDRVHVDLAGPLPTTVNGYKYVMVIKDYLTKYVWLVPLKTKTAAEVAESFVTKFICQAGIPHTVISDRGTEFVNQLLKNVCTVLGINRISTTPYNPRPDGFVENHNKTLKDQLFNYIDGLRQNDWDVYLPTVQLLYNTTVSLATGFTPMLLMTGREARMPSFTHMGKIIETLDPNHIDNEYVRDMVATMRGYEDFAIEQTEKNKLRFNVRVRQPLEFVEYKIGQKFMLTKRPITRFKSDDEKTAWKLSMKLLERFEGPYVITGVVNPVLYEAMINGETTRVHAVNMKPF